MVPMMLPAMVNGLNGLGPLNVATAVNEGAAPDPVAVFRGPSGLASPKSIGFALPWVSMMFPRLQVPVHNALAVSDSQRFGHSNADFENFVQRHRTFAQSFG